MVLFRNRWSSWVSHQVVIVIPWGIATRALISLSGPPDWGGVPTIGRATWVNLRLWCPRNYFIIFSIYAYPAVCKLFPTHTEVWGYGCPGSTSAQCQASPRFVPGTWCCLCSMRTCWKLKGCIWGIKLCPGFFSDAVFPLKPTVV